MQQEEGVASETSVEKLGVDLRMSTKQLGAKEKPRRKKCDVRFSLIRKHRIFAEKLQEDWCEKVAKDGPCERVGRRSGWRCAKGKAQVEETNGGSSRQEGIGVALTFHLSE